MTDYLEDIEDVTDHNQKRDLESRRALSKAEETYTLIKKYQEMNFKNRNIDFKVETEKLKARFSELTEKMSIGEALEELLVPAYALACEMLERVDHKTLYKSQVVGGVLLNSGIITEIATGEGKTLTALLPAFLNALSGQSVHILTANDYLAQRDYQTMSRLFEALGLSCGLVEDLPITGEEISRYATENGIRKGAAHKQLLKIKKQNTRKAYQSDVVYSSVSVMPFNYLRDCTATSMEETVRGQDIPGAKKPILAIIDEVDSVLIDDAVMNYRLTGVAVTAEKLGISDSYNNEPIDIRATAFAAFLYERIKNRETIYREVPKDLFTTALGYEKNQHLHSKYYFIISDDKKELSLTERGNMALFLHYGACEAYLSKDNDEESRQVREFILHGVDEQGKPMYTPGVDYTIDGELNGIANIILTEVGLQRVSNEIYPFKRMMSRIYSSNEWQTFALQIQNSLEAFFLRSKGEDDYHIEITETLDRSGKTVKVGHVVCMEHGRVADGRVFSEGMQQALEYKERYLASREDVGYTIEISKEHPVIMEISQRSFYEREYCKFAGMTGTASKRGFDTLYDKLTVVVPKNAEYNKTMSVRSDKTTIVYLDEESKQNAIVDDIIAAFRKKQPVLVAATSIEESKIIYAKVLKRLTPEERHHAQLLNPDTLNSKEAEANMIACAGIPGTITISTEMAGRGTDISLGGSVDNEYIRRNYEELATDAIATIIIRNEIAKAKQKGPVTDEMIATITRKIEMSKPEILTGIKLGKYNEEKVIQTIKQIVSERKQEAIATGGLRVISTGHFTTKREDRQLRGRSGRQSDPSSTIIYSSLENLHDIGMEPEDLEEIDGFIKKSGGRASNSTISELIAKTQERNANRQIDAISHAQERDIISADYVEYMVRKRNDILYGRVNLEKETLEIIEESISDMTSEYSYGKTLRDSKKLKSVSDPLDLTSIFKEMKETYGISITWEDVNGSCDTVEDVRYYLSDLVTDKLKAIKGNLSKEKYQEFLRDRLLYMYDNLWSNYQVNLDSFNMDRATRLMVDSEHAPKLETGIAKAFDSSRRESFSFFIKLVVTDSKSKNIKQTTDVVADTETISSLAFHTFENLEVRPYCIDFLKKDQVILVNPANGEQLETLAPCSIKHSHCK